MAVINPNSYTSKFGTKINTTGITGKPLAKIQGLADSAHGMAAQQLAKKRRLMIPKAVAPLGPQTPPAEAQPVVPPANNINTTPPVATTAPNPQDNANTLFPNTRMFEPKNYEGSPLYQFQVQQGQKQLGKSLASRGLSNSGYGIEQELNIPMMAAAQDTDRMTRVASENADRLKSFQDNEALRLERAGNNQWDRSYSLAQLMAQQSPWQGALSGLDNSATVTGKAGQDQANFLKNYFQRAIASGGGGRGSNAIPLIPPTGPDYSNIDPAKIAGGASSNNGWLDILTKGLAGLF